MVLRSGSHYGTTPVDETVCPEDPCPEDETSFREISEMCEGIFNDVDQLEKTVLCHQFTCPDIIPQPLSQIIADAREASESYTCGTCSIELTEHTPSIMCDGACNRWYHPSCSRLSTDEFQALEVDKESKWYCHTCVPTDTASSPFKVVLPPPDISMSDIEKAVWGELKGSQIFEAVNKAYPNVVRWRKNLFKVPTGKAGQGFIEELTKTLNLYNAASHFESVALTMALLMFPLLLQKPSQSSKSKDHAKFLEKRLVLWKAGEVEKLMKESTVIQGRLKSPKPSSNQHQRVFVRLMLQGKVSAALRWVGSQRSSLLQITPDVLNTLISKHPKPVSAVTESILKGPVDEIQDAIFESIDGEVIYQTAKKVSGSAGPSGADAETWQRILCSKQFKKKPTLLCEAIAELAKKLSCKLVHPDHLSSYTACRLIPLDKNPGVRPIGVGEVLRRIVGKAIMSTLKTDLKHSTAPIQVCGGLQGGVEAAIHSMRRIYEDPETEAILLVDAENAFNSLNREAALSNMQYTCPEFFKYVANTYRKPSDLYVANSDDIVSSEEGTTQGDTSAMGMYACGLMPLVKSLSNGNGNEDSCRDYPKQSFYADDAASGGKLKSIKLWWDDLQNLGPMYGYYPKPSKTWLIVKPGFYTEAKRLFPDVNITCEGHRYLGSYIGTDTGLENYIKGEMEKWKADITGLSEIAKTEPQLAYAAFVYGTSKRWNFVARTTPRISGLLFSLEYHIKETLIPALVGKLFIPEELRNIFALPAKMGGLGISNITETSELEYSNSVLATAALADAIFHQNNIFYEDDDAQHELLLSIKKRKDQFFSAQKQTVMDSCSPSVKRQLDLLSEKGASSWLTSLPLKEYGFLLNKQEFVDAIALRYNLTLSSLNRPKTCECGKIFSINHCLICKKGGFVALRHDSLKETIARLLEQPCKDVKLEPSLLNVTGEELNPGANISEGARLDISVIGFWTPLDRAFTDIRVLHPQAPSNSDKSLKQMYRSHEKEKKNAYNQRVIKVEKATFTPLVFSTTGGMGEECAAFLKHLAEKISMKTGQRYCEVIAFIRRRLRFDLLRTCLISLRGYRGKASARAAAIDNLDLNLRPQAVY